MVRRIRFAGDDHVESNKQSNNPPPGDHCAIWTDDDDSSDTEQAAIEIKAQATDRPVSLCRQKPPKSQADADGQPISNLRLLFDRQRKREDRTGRPLLCQPTPKRRVPVSPSLPPSGTHAYAFLTPGATSSPRPIPGRSTCHPFNGTNQILGTTCLPDGLPPAELAYKLPDGSGYDFEGESTVWVPWQIDPKVNKWSFMTNQPLREEHERAQYQNQFERAIALGWLRK